MTASYLTTRSVVKYHGYMSRWQPDARERLEHAALELFAKQGFNETTVPQIATQAGLTTRTFFRHFPDKREVLFAREEEINTLALRIVTDAPASLSLMELIAHGLKVTVASQFDDKIEFLRTRWAIIQIDEGLRERELRKQSTLSQALSTGFRNRGFDEVASTLAAQITVTVFNVALNRWLNQQGDRHISEFLEDTLETFRFVVAA